MARKECNKIIEKARSLGFENDITEGKLRAIIMDVRDIADQRQVLSWIRALLAFDCIELVVEHVYRIKTSI
jgi:hypothetical protein